MASKNKKSAKKKIKNGYQMFCEEQIRVRRLSITFVQAIDIFYDEWKTMSKQVQDEYKQSAKDWRLEQRSMAELHMEREIEREDIEARRDVSCSSRWITEQSYLGASRTLLYFISTLHVYKEPSDYYYPIEVGIVKYTIRNGFVGKFHIFPKPLLPMGALGDAVDLADRTHKIQIISHEEFEEDPVKVWRLLLTFLDSQSTLGVEAVPYLYARSEDVNKVTSCLAYLASQAGENPDKYLLRQRVLPFEDMAMEIVHRHSKHEASDIQTHPGERLYRGMYNQTPEYEYNPRIKCDFHAVEYNAHCALHIAHSMGMAMTNMLADLKMLTVTDGHAPHQSDIEQHTFERESDSDSSGESGDDGGDGGDGGDGDDGDDDDGDDGGDGDDDDDGGDGADRGDDGGDRGTPVATTASPTPPVAPTALGRGRGITVARHTPTYQQALGRGRGLTATHTKPATIGRGCHRNILAQNGGS